MEILWGFALVLLEVGQGLGQDGGVVLGGDGVHGQTRRMGGRCFKAGTNRVL